MWRQVISLKQAKLGVNQAALAAYSGVHQTKVSRFLSGLQDLPNEIVLNLNDTLNQLEKLAIIFDPAPLDFSKIIGIKTLIKKLEDGDYSTQIVQKALSASHNLDGVDGKSVPELAARYQCDREFSQAIDRTILHQSTLGAL